MGLNYQWPSHGQNGTSPKPQPHLLLYRYKPSQHMSDFHQNLIKDWINTINKTIKSHFFTPQPSGLEGYCRHGPGGRAGGCQTCGTHISVTARWIFSIRSSVELSRPVGVHCHGHMPICPIWSCPWAKNLSNLPQIGSRLCGTHISETAAWIYPI